MRSFVPAIYDVTVALPKSSPPPTMLRIFKGQPSVVSQSKSRFRNNCIIISVPSLSDYIKYSDNYVSHCQPITSLGIES